MEKQVTLSYTEHHQLLDKIKELKKYIHDAEVNGKIRIRKIPVYNEQVFQDRWGLDYYKERPKDPLKDYNSVKAEENTELAKVTQQLCDSHEEITELRKELKEASKKLKETNSKIPWYRK